VANCLISRKLLSYSTGYTDIALLSPAFITDIFGTGNRTWNKTKTLPDYKE